MHRSDCPWGRQGPHGTAMGFRGATMRLAPAMALPSCKRCPLRCLYRIHSCRQGSARRWRLHVAKSRQRCPWRRQVLSWQCHGTAMGSRGVVMGLANNCHGPAQGRTAMCFAPQPCALFYTSMAYGTAMGVPGIAACVCSSH